MIDITEEYLKERIYEIRGQRVILDADLSEIYGYTTKAFNQQVKNNIEKFDEDFMFELTDDEVENMRSNFLTANLNSKSRYNPHVFTEQAGKLLISIIAAVAEMERENIRVQTMAGREQKAREGKWNGGFAPYGYRLENGELVIAEDEVEIIQMIFDRYIHTNDGTKTRMICRWAIIRVLHYPDSYTALSRYAFNLFFSSM